MKDFSTTKCLLFTIGFKAFLQLTINFIDSVNENPVIRYTVSNDSTLIITAKKSTGKVSSFCLFFIFKGSYLKTKRHI